ncbi:hypothetical protein NE464_21970, partial [Eubacterium callanderi]|nr:hypothetical protein [Eubacterium callanderi]
HALTGMHINEDHFIAEIIDPVTLEVLPEGETGELVITPNELLASEIKARLGVPPLIVSAKTKEGMDRIREALIRSLPKDHEAESITGNLCADGDLVMLVM